MRVKTEQLSSHLNKFGLLPIYYVSGDEPLQLIEATDLIRAQARANGYEERTVLDVETGFDWSRLHEAGANLSLFSTKRIIELKLGGQKPGREGGAALTEYAANHSPDNVLLMTSDKTDKKTQQTKWFKALDKCGCSIQVWPVGPAQLPGWIMARCQRQNKRIDKDAATLIAQRVEGNLLAAKQEIDKLALIVEKADINSGDVLNMVVDSARFDVFDLIESVFLGKPERIAKMLRGLKKEGVEPLGIYGALMWAFRRANSIAYEISRGKPKEQVFNAHQVWNQRRTATDTLINRFSPDRLAALLSESIIIDKALKGALRADSWQLLESFMFAIAGVRLESGPLPKNQYFP